MVLALPALFIKSKKERDKRMLSVAEIKQFIAEDCASVKKLKAKEGQRYYDAEHDILNCRFFYFNDDGNLVEDKYRANNKICHPFFTELSDQLSAYMLSFEKNPIQAKEKAEGLQEHLDNYFDDEFWAEIADLISGTYNKGFEYIYAFKNAENRLQFQCADSMGVIEVREKDTDDGCKYIIYWYIDRIAKDVKTVKKIQVWSESDTRYYEQVDNGDIIEDADAPINPRPHVVFTDKKSGQKMGFSLGYIPFWRLDLNRKQTSGLKPIKSLIDDYDMMQCGLSNNLTDFDTPLHVVKGYPDDNLDELQTNLKTKKIVGVDEEGGIEVHTVDIPYQARQAKAADDEKNIYRFGMGFNTAGLKDTVATTNLVIKAAYALLDLKADKLEIRLKRLLKQDIIKVVLAEINQENGTDYQMSDIEIKFTRSIITNERENADIEKVKADTEQVKVNTLLNVAASVGEEQTLKALCEVLDWNYEDIKSAVEKAQEEADLAAAQNALNNVVIDEPIEE